MKKITNLLLVLTIALGMVSLAEAKPRTVKIKVSSAGFTPSSLTVKKNQKVRLLLTRTDAKNCGGEVVFSSLNVRKTLPVGKTVAVEFTPTESGEIAFACGMGMMKGKILVQ